MQFPSKNKKKEKTGPHCRLLTLFILSTLTTLGNFNPTYMSLTALSCGQSQVPSSAVLNRLKSWTGAIFPLFVSKPHGNMVVSPLFRCRAKQPEMLCFAECGELTGVLSLRERDLRMRVLYFNSSRIIKTFSSWSVSSIHSIIAVGMRIFFLENMKKKKKKQGEDRETGCFQSKVTS